MVESLGGAARIKALKAVAQKVSMVLKTPQGDMSLEGESLLVFPDRQRQVMRAPMGEMTTVLSPTTAFVSGPMGTREMGTAQHENMLRDLRTSALAVARGADDPALEVREAGSEKLGDVDARVLELRVAGTQVRWLVDPASGRLLRSSMQTIGPAGPTEQSMDYSDWRAVDGVFFSYKRAIRRNGEDAGSMQLTEVKLDPEVDPKLFEKPAEAPKP